jgi:hypothetical protein
VVFFRASPAVVSRIPCATVAAWRAASLSPIEMLRHAREHGVNLIRRCFCIYVYLDVDAQSRKIVPAEIIRQLAPPASRFPGFFRRRGRRRYSPSHGCWLGHSFERLLFTTGCGFGRFSRVATRWDLSRNQRLRLVAPAFQRKPVRLQCVA